ncbi:hypothetical protein VNO77_41999 [Canavalia gladiata]|uniref:Uncharacterized protein n=1 Tax=Canavalia gladiata TaxID=3824 RepID=A0AAN9JZF7_CANGL
MRLGGLEFENLRCEKCPIHAGIHMKLIEQLYLASQGIPTPFSCDNNPLQSGVTWLGPPISASPALNFLFESVITYNYS